MYEECELAILKQVHVYLSLQVTVRLIVILERPVIQMIQDAWRVIRRTLVDNISTVCIMYRCNKKKLYFRINVLKK